MGNAPLVSLYAKHDAPRPVCAMPIDEVVRSIAIPPATRIEIVSNVRRADSHDKRKALKGLLPGATWCGTFSKRGKANLEQHSGYIYVDIDATKADKETLDGFESAGHVSAPDLRRALREDALKIRAAVVDQPWCAAAWLSASAFGVGLLVPGECWHSAAAAASKAVEHLCCEIDQGAKDVSRLNYLSHDFDTRFNEDAVPPPKVEIGTTCRFDDAPKALPRVPVESANGIDRSRNPQIALDCIAQGLVGEYKPGTNSYGASGQMTVALSLFCDGDASVLAAWLDKLEADGRFVRAVTDKAGNVVRYEPSPQSRHWYTVTWNTGGGITKSNAGVFINKVLAEAKARGLPSPFASATTQRRRAQFTRSKSVDYGF